jgi:heme oxygenase
MDIMVSLKETTRDAHLRLERRLDIKNRFSNLSSYREHIAQLLAFHAAAEHAWARWLTPVLSDFPARRKVHLLERDLIAIGGVAIPAVSAVPDLVDSASALGGFYVLEGATLGTQHLLPMVQRSLCLSGAQGASYLASYGAEVGDMWRRFGASVTAHCQSASACDRAIIGAQVTFQAIEDSLCGAQV